MIQRVSMRFPGGLPKVFTISYDDGVIQDVRLIELMEKYGIRGTFNINSARFPKEDTIPEGKVHGRMTLSECKKAYSSPNVEVVCHGAVHKYLTDIPSQSALFELYSDRVALEREFGGIIRGLAYPYGPSNEDVQSAARLCGFLYARATHKSLSLAPPPQSEWLDLSPTCHHDAPELEGLVETFTETSPNRQPYFFYVWGHSYEFDRKDNWDRAEWLFKTVSGRPDVWYATNTEVFEYMEAFNKLIFSGDGLTVYNPTAMTLYANTDYENVVIPSGATVVLKGEE